MSRSRPRLRWLSVAIVLWLLAGCAGGTRDLDIESSAVFPLPADLEDEVNFWRNVYAHWSRGQVAFHDDRYLGLVYEVADLPGPIEASYTPAQRDWVQARTEHWRSRLDALADRLGEGRGLSAEERDLLAKIEAAAGRSAVFGAGERVRSQRGVRERFRRGLEVSGRYDGKFREVFRRHGLPEDLAYLPHVESSFQLNARSSAGASGMWQFMRSTGRQYMTVNGAIDERLDPVVAADAAARYLKGAQERLHAWPLALTSYNHGVGGMLKAKARYGNDIGRIVHNYDGRYFGFASRNFYAEFLAARHVASHATHYFPEGLHYEPSLDHDVVVLRSDVPAMQLARYYKVPLPTLVELNLAWLPAVQSGVRPVPAGSTVWLPAGATRRVSGAPLSSYTGL